jgi:hypothetical protein
MKIVIDKLKGNKQEEVDVLASLLMTVLRSEFLDNRASLITSMSEECQNLPHYFIRVIEPCCYLTVYLVHPCRRNIHVGSLACSRVHRWIVPDENLFEIALLRARFETHKLIANIEARHNNGVRETVDGGSHGKIAGRKPGILGVLILVRNG